MPKLVLLLFTGVLLFWSPARAFEPPAAVTGAEEEQAVATRFRGMDRNNDGVITRDEWRGSEQSFRVNDWNGDGVLSGAEVRPNARRDPNDQFENDQFQTDQDDWMYWGEDSFVSLDTNRDGRITAREWRFGRQSFMRADRNSDNVLSRNEFLAVSAADNRDRRFEYLDTDNDNNIERNEWRGSLDAFNWLDRNRNGVLSRREVVGNVGGGYVGRDPNSGDAFASIDYNNNGVISREEWHPSRGNFDARDTNNDGVISRREFGLSENTASGIGSLHREMQVPSTQQWTDTGIDVRAGDVIRVNADGTIQLSDNPNDRANPAGAGRRAPNAPVGTAPAGALLVRIGNSAPVYVGANGTVPRAPVSGRLYLGVNDDHMPDNAGAFHVVLDIDR